MTSKRSDTAGVDSEDNFRLTFSRVHVCEDFLDAAKLRDGVDSVRSQRMDELVLIVLGIL